MITALQPRENNDFCVLSHKSIIASFEREGVDVFEYIKSRGYEMNPSNFSYHTTLDDGERVLSSMEYDFSLFLRELGLKYKKDYLRDVYYKSFLPLAPSSKLTCDYVIMDHYIEIAGIIHNDGINWEAMKYKSLPEQKYLEKMKMKKSILERYNKKYLFLFPEDFDSEKYRTLFLDFIYK